MNKRRTIRKFSSKNVPIEVVKECVRAAATAPSGANKQPWYFAIVQSEGIKAKIREAAEKEEYCFYHKRNNKEWLNDLKPFKTNWQKPHLEEASTLIVIFSKTFEDEEKTKRVLLFKGVCRDRYWNFDNGISSLRNFDINSYTKTNELFKFNTGKT